MYGSDESIIASALHSARHRRVEAALSVGTSISDSYAGHNMFVLPLML